MRSADTLAVVGLDGTYGFQGSTDVLTNAYGYAPERMRAAFLDLRRAQDEPQTDLNLESVQSFRYADRTLVGLRNMHHSDFTSFAMIASKFDVPIKTNYLNTGWDRETGRRGFEATCGIVLGFLDDKLKEDTAGAERFRETVRISKGSTFVHLGGVCAPPSPREAVALANQRGIDALRSIFMEASGEQPAGSCVDPALFNTYGYELLGQHQTKDALVIFEIAAWAHPSSANAFVQLAGGDYHEFGGRVMLRSFLRQMGRPSLEGHF